MYHPHRRGPSGLPLLVEVPDRNPLVEVRPPIYDLKHQALEALEEGRITTITITITITVTITNTNAITITITITSTRNITLQGPFFFQLYCLKAKAKWSRCRLGARHHGFRFTRRRRCTSRRASQCCASRQRGCDIEWDLGSRSMRAMFASSSGRACTSYVVCVQL